MTVDPCSELCDFQLSHIQFYLYPCSPRETPLRTVNTFDGHPQLIDRVCVLLCRTLQAVPEVISWRDKECANSIIDASKDRL